ncbi:MAG TPA: serine/threonine protein kinase [Bacteroidota bacterium]
MIKTKRCQYCGKETPFDAAECSHCKGALVAKPCLDVLDHFAAVKCALSEKYEIIAEIGQGGNATVYQAIQKNLDRKVALKVLLPSLVNDPGYMERFHLEARAIAKLRHPNIVTIYDEGNEQGVHFIAMEFLEGKDLHQLVRDEGNLRPQEAVEMAKCIAGALDFAHSYGIIHRDVKSSNIIMTSTRTAVLTDFGIAKSGFSQPHTKAGWLLGTPEFMSPEQARGKSVDPSTDFYSLGVVLYHTLSGHYPFQGDSPITTIHKILYENPVPLSRVVTLPPALERAIELCLVKDPEKRVQSGKELIELLNSDTVKSSPDTVETTAPSPAGNPVQARVRGKGEVSQGRVVKLPPALERAIKLFRVKNPEKMVRNRKKMIELMNSDTVESSPLTVEASAPCPAGKPVQPPAPEEGDVFLHRPPPPSPGLPVHRGVPGRRRPLVRTLVLATVACLMLTGYVTWQRALKADVRTTPVEAATAIPPDRKLVPYLIGETKEEAITLLRREGFEIGGIRVVAVPNPEKRGKVDSQRPSEGSMAKPGTTVDLLMGE